ncbi:preprotein translocase subunit YajC [Corynebacterium rhinophilum]|uniref:preprotein translocase subunit YajC n=1 Tax=Corynebacterium rhinophilum TaxID=3050197 RepID=UPI0025512C4B|nr:preprotein translocase subunit YajC [Corynebacterium sp. MSK082]MDK8647557.1 preprotein translocase subunit YajC [Corynebacterium sp. MSK082]
MEIIFLIIIVILFIIPSFMAMRKQRQRQNDMQSLQNSLQNGDRIVTAGGVHGVVRGTTDTSVDLEVSPGVTLTFDKMAVVRTESEAQNLARGGADNAGEPQRNTGENNNDDGFTGGEGEQPSNR